MMTENEQMEYTIQANEALERGPYLHHELVTILKSTHGSITYRRLAAEMGNIVGHVCIMNYMKQLDGFSYTTNHVYPHLDVQAKARRVEWCHAFWLFWLSAKATKSRTQLVLVHMDEKWFYAMVSRTKNKKITSLGVVPRHNTTHHKSHIHKVLVIAATGLIVNDNDIEAGGRGVRLSLSRAGKMVRARKDSYKRVYAEDGTYSYPCIAANRIRRKGELYWKDCDITGSDPGTEKDPKYAY